MADKDVPLEIRELINRLEQQSKLLVERVASDTAKDL